MSSYMATQRLLTHFPGHLAPHLGASRLMQDARPLFRYELICDTEVA